MITAMMMMMMMMIILKKNKKQYMLAYISNYFLVTFQTLAA